MPPIRYVWSIYKKHYFGKCKKTLFCLESEHSHFFGAINKCFSVSRRRRMAGHIGFKFQGDFDVTHRIFLVMLTLFARRRLIVSLETQNQSATLF